MAKIRLKTITMAGGESMKLGYNVLNVGAYWEGEFHRLAEEYRVSAGSPPKKRAAQKRRLDEAGFRAQAWVVDWD